jgi:hypothetical protein
VDITGAIIREQGVTFAVVAVKHHVVQNRSEAERAIVAYAPIFKAPVVLMAQDGRGVPTYFGRKDLSRFLASIPMAAIPWKNYRVN